MLHIGAVSGHACIRKHKMNLPLIDKGYKIYAIASRYTEWSPRYEHWAMASCIKNYVDAIKLIDSKVDIWHVHNEPSWFVSAIKEISKKPVILDVHDSYVTRLTIDDCKKLDSEDKEFTRISSEERNNFQLADGLVFPGAVFSDEVCISTFELEQPQLVLPSYCPVEFYQYNLSSWKGGIVYEGRLDSKEKVENDKNYYGFKYCEYETLAGEFKRHGVDFHVYAGEQHKDDFKDKAMFHVALPYNKMLKEISSHDWGLVGNIHETNQWDVAEPNKLYEYIAAGVPICVMNAKNVANIVKKYDIGIVVNSVDELIERWPEHREKRINLYKMRVDFSMENHLTELEKFYERFL